MNFIWKESKEGLRRKTLEDSRKDRRGLNSSGKGLFLKEFSRKMDIMNKEKTHEDYVKRNKTQLEKFKRDKM